MYGLFSMFQACVSISACIFYVFMNIYIHRIYCWVKKKNTDLHLYLPYFSIAQLRQYNNNKIDLSMNHFFLQSADDF